MPPLISSFAKLALGYLGLHTPAYDGPGKNARVAIIGAGPAGISFLKGMSTIPPHYRENWKIDVFEQRDGMGGIWLPDSNFTREEVEPETALYHSLTTVDATPMMVIPGYPLPPSTPLHAPHWDYLAYIQNLAKSSGLEQSIHYGHRAIDAHWAETQWEVKIAVNGSYAEKRYYDHLVVATGRDTVPFFPDIPGEKEWLEAGLGHRRIIHSKWFRGGEIAKGKVVIVVGDKRSGQVVSRSVVPYAEEVIHSWSGVEDFPPRSTPIDGTTRVLRFVRFNKDSVVFADGTEYATPKDAIVFYCTGYKLSYPFLSDLDVVDGSEWPVDSINHRLAVDEDHKHIRPLAYRLFANQPQYPLNALAFTAIIEQTFGAVSGFSDGLLLAHSILDPSLLDSKEKGGEDLLAYEQYLREGSREPFKRGIIFRPLMGLIDWYDHVIDIIRNGSHIPLPPAIPNPYYDDLTRTAACHYLFRSQEAWRHATAISPKFALGFTRGAKTDRDYGLAMARLIKWYHGWVKANNVTLEDDYGGLC